ncbi:AC5 protein [Hedyotis uncinella yellow mosaic virus]|uniref:AC5 protein n=1 Tax=Hedyotis uncinella yellow mosaic virus TaxID=1428190 RepID=S5REP9_9GEMI|nr:AC5 protein [Hedyotis uncinella yellow mosaic virus]AGS12479.1 AC5 protein [Hedyotis uncinella yellow mosaic virus]
MSTCHVQQQSILSVILILSSLLMIITNMIVQLHKLPHQSLFLARILSTSSHSSKSTKNLISTPKIILNSSRTRLIIIHIKNLSEIHRSPKGTSIPNNKKHNCIGVILSLDILIHPHLTQNIHGLDTEPLANTMGEPISTSDIRHTNDLPSMGYIMTLFK